MQNLINEIDKLEINCDDLTEGEFDERCKNLKKKGGT